MELEHSFRVPAPVDEAFAMLIDIEKVAPCMPGATLVSMDAEDEFTGEVLVKVGPMRMSYRGKAKIVDIDRDNHRAVVEAKGREVRGTGTAAATVTATLTADGAETVARVITDLAVTGRPAQFGRGIMVEVGDRLLAEFAKRLGNQMTEMKAAAIYAPEPEPAVSSNGAAAVVPAPAEVSAHAPAVPESATPGASAPVGAALASATAESATPEVSAPAAAAAATPTAKAAGSGDSINLVSIVMVPVLKRLVPVAIGAVIGALIVWLVMR